MDHWFPNNVNYAIKKYQNTMSRKIKGYDTTTPVPFLGYSTVPGNITVTHNKQWFTIPTMNGTTFVQEWDPMSQYEIPPESLPILAGNETFSVRWVAWVVGGTEYPKVTESASGEVVIRANPLKEASQSPVLLMTVPNGFVDSGAFARVSAGRMVAWAMGAVGLFSMYLIL
ncbi:hypothetical protein HK104_005149 [Borealophlyctis nickersoniae]|nr:hypothetical protein HK104_005149 [Borealophlyctis nickersoniae]